MKRLTLLFLVCANLWAAYLPMTELYQIRIHNQTHGVIEASVDRGKTWKKIGSVTVPAQNQNTEGFTASKWGKNSSVVASAVNAIHIKITQGINDRGIIFSIIPKEDQPNSHAEKYSSIQTSFPAGSGIFGGEWSVLVGNPVYCNDRLLDADYIPRPGDFFVIRVLRPRDYPTEMIFENTFGGKITLKYRYRRTELVGQVLKPVYGVGRFTGTKYCDVGRVRANHNGVIDISTSPLDKIGGFQIIPAHHAESPEMSGAKTKTQWMIIGPVDPTKPGEEGLAPFFSGYITPRYDQNDLKKKDWKKSLAQRTLVQVKYKNNKYWHAMPCLVVDPHQPPTEENNTALENVEKIRILFPVFRTGKKKL